MSELFIPGEQPKAPLLPDGTPKKRFEVVMKKGKNGVIEKGVYIDGELLDWSIDMTSLADAIKMGPKYFRAAQADIIRHYIESVSETIGRKVSLEDIKEAIKTGWI